MSFRATVESTTARVFRGGYMGGAFIIPLVALLFPILLLIAALTFDAALIAWFAYRAWHDRVHWHWRGFPHL